MKLRRLLASAIFILTFLYIFPLFMSEPIFLHTFFTLFIFAAIAQAFNLIAGYAGYLSLGHTVYYGLGMYVAAIVLKSMVQMDVYSSLMLAYLAGGIAAAIFGLVTSVPLFRLRGATFALGTLGIAEFMRVLFQQYWMGMGGSSGLFLHVSSPNKVIFYSIALTLMLISVLTAFFIRKSRFGLALLSIREDEDAAEVLGIKTLNEKLKAVAISAFITGVCGSVMASYTLYVAPEIAFSLLISLQMQFMPIIGGLGTIFGPIIGAMILVVTDEIFTTITKGAIYYGLGTLLYASTMLLIMRFLPEGLWGAYSSRRRRAFLRASKKFKLDARHDRACP